MSDAPIPLETLLAHREWVRAVARAVVRDENAADDVEQETWLAALSSPPRNESSLRGWFGAVTRSRARRIGRSESRRDTRESAVARREATPSAADLAELADTHRRVVAAVVELDEPYRETILLRYFEGLAIDAVAARSGVPLETARSRLKRGVAKLRERLAEELGEDDRPWELALAPLIGKSHGAAIGAATGGLLMASTTKTAVAVAAVLLLIGGGAVVASKWTANDPPAVASAPVAAPPRSAAKQEKLVAVPRPPRQRTAQDAAPAPPPPAPKPQAPAETVRQRLERAKLTAAWHDVPVVTVIAELAAKSDVEIVVSQEAVKLLRGNDAVESLRIDEEIRASQALDLVTQLMNLKWIAEEPRAVVVSPDESRPPSSPDVVPPKWTPPGPIDVTGRVTDANGDLVTGAEIVRVFADSARAVATTDASGHYAVHLPFPYGSLEARTAGQVRSFTASVSGQPGTQVTLDFALRGAAGSLAVRATTEGRVLPGVVVTLGTDAPRTKSDERPLTQHALSETTDAQGTAVFPGVPPGRVAVIARAQGFDDVIRIVQVAAGNRTEAEMTLVPKVPLKEKIEKQHISFNFQGASFKDVVKFINDAKSLNVVVDPAIAPRLETCDVTLDLHDVSIAEALRQLCNLTGGVTYKLQDEVVWITADKR